MLNEVELVKFKQRKFCIHVIIVNAIPLSIED